MPARASIASRVPTLFYVFELDLADSKNKKLYVYLYHPICDHNCLRLLSDDLDGRGAITSLLRHHPCIHSIHLSCLFLTLGSFFFFLFFPLVLAISNPFRVIRRSLVLGLWGFCRYLACFL